MYTKTATANEPSSYDFTVYSADAVSAVIADYMSSNGSVSIAEHSSALTTWDGTSPYTLNVGALGTSGSKLLTILMGRGTIIKGYGCNISFAFQQGQNIDFSGTRLISSPGLSAYKDLYTFGSDTLGFGSPNTTRSAVETVGPATGAKGWGLLIALSD